MSENYSEWRPAAYPRTATAEQETKDIFQQLLDRCFVQGELRALDKYPNDDGILEMTTEDGVPVGKVTVQLKTLQPQSYASPAYPCDRRFLSSCFTCALPVFLVVVNRRDKKAYWRHIDRRTLSEVPRRSKATPFPFPS